MELIIGVEGGNINNIETFAGVSIGEHYNRMVVDTRVSKLINPL